MQQEGWTAAWDLGSPFGPHVKQAGPPAPIARARSQVRRALEHAMARGAGYQPRAFPARGVPVRARTIRAA